MTKKLLPITIALVSAAIIVAPAASAQSAERTKAMKAFASMLKPKTYGQTTTGKALVNENTILVPLSVSTTELVDEQKAIAFIDGIASGFCQPQVYGLMKQYQFSVTFDLSINGSLKSQKSFSGEQCSAIESAKKAKDSEKFARDNGFGTPGLVTAIPGRESLPLFSFRGWQAGVNLSSTALEEDCETKSSVAPMIVQCESKVFDLSGARAGSIVQIYNGKLSALRIISSSDYAEFILDAFKVKYGKPCKSDIEVWQNGFGGKFDNPVFTWCFRTGNLIFSSIGRQKDNIEINYNDVNEPKVNSPTINF